MSDNLQFSVHNVGRYSITTVMEVISDSEMNSGGYFMEWNRTIGKHRTIL